jgi:gliding motility-associated-like protein
MKRAIRSLLWASLLAPFGAFAQEPCAVYAVATAVSCAGESDGSISVIALEGGPFTYFWVHDLNITGPDATGLDAMIYAVVVTDPATGCVSDLFVSVPEPSVEILGDLAYCPADPPLLTATVNDGFDADTYAWSTGEDTQSIQIPAGFEGNVDVTVTSADGCEIDATVSLVQLTPPSVLMAVVDSACQNVAFIANTVATNADSLIWRWDGWGFSNLRDPLVNFTTSGWRPISLQGYDLNGCGSLPLLDSVYIRAQVPAIFTATQVPCTPQVDIVLGSTADSCAFFIGDSLVTHDCATYFRWDFGLYREYALTLFATQANNCNDTTLIVVDVRTEPTLFLANAFTPNDDGINDKWPDRVDIPDTGYELKLFDRWGRSIWSTTNPVEQWDGASTPMGVYVYTMRMRDPCYPTNEITKTGHVTVFR